MPARQQDGGVHHGCQVLDGGIKIAVRRAHRVGYCAGDPGGGVNRVARFGNCLGRLGAVAVLVARVVGGGSEGDRRARRNGGLADRHVQAFGTGAQHVGHAGGLGGVHQRVQVVGIDRAFKGGTALEEHLPHFPDEGGRAQHAVCPVIAGAGGGVQVGGGLGFIAVEERHLAPQRLQLGVVGGVTVGPAPRPHDQVGV